MRPRRQPDGPPLPLRPPLAVLPAWVALLLALAACDVGWEGARFAIEVPPAAEDTATAEEEEDVERPLPAGELLYVGLRAAGGYRVTPAARLTPAGPAALALPTGVDSTWWRRFDAAFLAPGRELGLLAEGGRRGSVVLAGPAGRRPGCAPVTTGTPLLPPAVGPPATAFAVSSGLAGGRLRTDAYPEPTSRMRTFAPILAERLLEEEGVERAFLARLVDLQAVALPGDTAAGMSATYLVNDSLAAVPPPGPAISLFFLARFEPGEGYVPVWSVVRRYEEPAEKEVYVHAGSVPVAGTVTVFLWRYGSSDVRLSAAWSSEASGRSDRRAGEGAPPAAGKLEMGWTEAARCTVARRLDLSPPEPPERRGP